MKNVDGMIENVVQLDLGKEGGRGLVQGIDLHSVPDLGRACRHCLPRAGAFRAPCLKSEPAGRPRAVLELQRFEERICRRQEFVLHYDE